MAWAANTTNAILSLSLTLCFFFPFKMCQSICTQGHFNRWTNEISVHTRRHYDWMACLKWLNNREGKNRILSVNYYDMCANWRNSGCIWSALRVGPGNVSELAGTNIRCSQLQNTQNNGSLGTFEISKEHEIGSQNMAFFVCFFLF